MELHQSTAQLLAAVKSVRDMMDCDDPPDGSAVRNAGRVRECRAYKGGVVASCLTAKNVAI